MQVMVLGAGRMGRAAAWDLARQPGVERLCLVDHDATALEVARGELARLLERAAPHARPRIETRCCSLDDAAQLPALLASADVALSSADYRFNEALTRAAIEAQCHLCDLGGNVHVVERQLALHAEAERRGVTVIPDCGLAPGLACLLAARAVERLERTEAIQLRVGGLPKHPKPPLNYKLVFSARGLVNEYLEPSEVLRDGVPVRVPSLSEVERVSFPPFGLLEAFHTSGGASTLPRTLQGKVRQLDYKTLRYPGHAAAFAALQALGLLSEEPVDGVVPRQLTERLLERALEDDDTDVVLLRVTAEGYHEGRRQRLVVELVDEHDEATGHSAMARTTAYSAAAVAYLLGAGAIARHGVLPGELALPLERTLEAVRARGLDLQERWERLS